VPKLVNSKGAWVTHSNHSVATTNPQFVFSYIGLWFYLLGSTSNLQGSSMPSHAHHSGAYQHVTLFLSLFLLVSEIAEVTPSVKQNHNSPLPKISVDRRAPAWHSAGNWNCGDSQLRSPAKCDQNATVFFSNPTTKMTTTTTMSTKILPLLLN
jgi:hypothetical protein